LRNFPVPLVGGLMKWIIFPLGLPYSPPSDSTGKKIAKILLSENESRERLIDGVFVSDADDATGRLHTAFHLVLESAAAEQAIGNALKETVTIDNYEDLVRRAVESGVITEEQASMVRLAQQACAVVIAVDDFPRSVVENNVNTDLHPPVANSG
jgi:acyl-CoA dehydrogenase